MKILDVCESYAERGGGVKTYIDQKLAVGTSLGHEIVIIAPGPETRIEDKNGGRIRWIKAPKTPDPRYHMFLRSAPIHKAIEDETPDVVEGSSPWLGGQAVAKWQGSAAKVFFMHQDPVSAYPQALLGRYVSSLHIDILFGWFWRYIHHMAKRYDASVVASQWFANRVETFGLQRPHIIPLGVNKTEFTPAPQDPETRAELLAECGLDADARLLVVASRMHPEKRYDLIIDAFEMASQHINAGLVILGDGPARRFVAKRAARNRKIHMAGFINDRATLSRILSSADALVHGGAFEPFGLAVAEAVCSGLALVVPNTGGAAEIAEPTYAEFYQVNNAASCAAAIETILRRNPLELKLAATVARQHKILSPDDHFEQLFNFYSGLLRKRAGTRHATSGNTIVYPAA